MANYPLITAATITSLVTALIALLRAFGIGATPEQEAAILTLVALVAPWAVALVGHKFTTPLSNPTDIDGEPLTRSNGDPAINAGGK